MTRLAIHWAISTVVAFAMLQSAAPAQQAPATAAPNREVDAIRKASQAYVAALNKGDAQALLAAWAPDGDFIDARGNRQLASDLIKKEFAQRQPGGEELGLTVDENTTIRLVSDSVAIEDGITETDAPGGLRIPIGRFTAVWVKQNNRWLLASVRESAITPTKVQRPIDELDWMLGDWTAEADDMQYVANARWDDGEHFILRDLEVRRGDQLLMHATQRIGWDPVHKAIRSWAFDSDGGYGEGAWVAHGDVWYVKNRGTLVDGKEVTSINTYTLNEDGTVTWRVEGAAVRGEKGPELTITFHRAN